MKNMTEPTHVRRPLYRTVLSLGIAALVAAWLPFTVLYVTALRHKPAAQITSVTYSHGRPTIVTRTSGGQTITTAAGSTTGQQAPAVQPVTTRAS